MAFVSIFMLKYVMALLLLTGPLSVYSEELDMDRFQTSMISTTPSYAPAPSQGDIYPFPVQAPSFPTPAQAPSVDTSFPNPPIPAPSVSFPNPPFPAPILPPYYIPTPPAQAPSLTTPYPTPVQAPSPITHVPKPVAPVPSPTTHYPRPAVPAPSPTTHFPKPAAPTPSPIVTIPTPTPPSPVVGPIRSHVAVQGVVFCKPCQHKGVDTLVGATPITGATVRVQCNNTKVPMEKQAKTDKNGYFFLHTAPSLSNYGTHKCKAFLVSSPLNSCRMPTNLHQGVTGASLRYERPKSPTTPYALFTVGPFAFEPNSCPH